MGLQSLNLHFPLRRPERLCLSYTDRPIDRWQFAYADEGSKLCTAQPLSSLIAFANVGSKISLTPPGSAWLNPLFVMTDDTFHLPETIAHSIP